MKKLIIIFLCFLSLSAFGNQFNYENSVKGKKIIIGDAFCAGWYFNKDGTKATWQNEIECTKGFISNEYWSVKWIDKNVILFVETVKQEEGLSPRTTIYKVNSGNSKQLKVTEYWTSWGTVKPHNLEFRIK